MLVALDDVGLGHSNFKMMVDVRPDVLKLDRYFVSGVAGDDYKQAIVRAVMQLARAVEASVVAEGVAEAEDLEAVRGMGVPLVQGFLFARPAGAPELTRLPLVAAAVTAV
jgi:EAL domain-containing protein (putative c-di-GMP-specific phosphodiesterase class I)